MARTRRITPDEWRKLKPKLTLTDRLICDIMRQTGYRVSDVLSLTVLQCSRCKITVTEQKTGKIRITHIRSRTCGELRKYAERRGKRPHERMFDCDVSTVYRHITTAAEQLGFDHISAHSFRKAFAYDYAKCYGLTAAQKELQHDRLETTMIYCLDLEAIVENEKKGR